MIMKLLSILVYSLVIISLVLLFLLIFKSDLFKKKSIFYLIIIFLFSFTTITFTAFPSNFIFQRFLRFCLYLIILLTIYFYNTSKKFYLVKLCIAFILIGNLFLFI